MSSELRLPTCYVRKAAQTIVTAPGGTVITCAATASEPFSIRPAQLG